MKHFGDITKLSGYDLPPVSIITGGSPCQDLSVAGKRAGLAGERSGLFMEQIRLIKEMRENDRKNGRTDEHIRPRFMVWENVPGAFSSNKGEDFRAVLEETAKVAEGDARIPGSPNGKWPHSGCIMGDGWSIAWRVHDAQFWGVPQRRKRIALVADFGGGTAPEILFEREGMSGNSAESGEERKGTAENAERGVGEASITCLNDQGGSVMGVSENVTGALRAQEHGHQPAVCYGISSYESNAMKSANPHSGVYEAETSRTLDLNGGNPACNQGGIAVVFDASRRHNYEPFGDVCETVQAAYGTGGGNVPIVLEGNGSRPSHMGDGWHEGDPMYTLNSTEHHAVCYRGDAITSPVNASNPQPGDPCHTLTDDSRNYVVVESSAWDGGQTSPTLTANNADGSQRMPDKENFNAVVQSLETFHCTNEQDKVQTLKARDYKDPQIVAYGLDRASYNQGQNAKFGFCIDEEKIGAQVAKGPGAVCTSVVRRLTPMECERLQGFPDHWTDIGDWVDSKGKKHKGESDSPRYKALGNSIALPFWQWMAEKMVKYVDEKTMASLFSGIGGFELVFARSGCKPVWNSEIESFPEAVTRVHFGDDDLGIEGDYERYL